MNMLQKFLQNRKASMHTWAPTDLFIILGGVVGGIILVYVGIQQGWMPSSFFCPLPPVP